MKVSDINIAFFGTPELAVYVLEELKEAGIVPTLVVTMEDKPAGRKLALTPPPVKVWALEHDIEVLQPTSLKSEDEIELLANTEWDLFVVAAYNAMLPQALLDLPHFGVLNVHPSLLPKLRGPSPVRSAIRNDVEACVGVSIISLDEKMDHGPLVAQATVELPQWPERGTVLDEILFREGGRLLTEVIPAWIHGEITPEEQNHTEATYTEKFSKKDGEILLEDDGYTNYLKFCAHDGWPGTFFFANCHGKQVRVKVTDAEYSEDMDTFNILKVIPEGKKEMEYEVWQKSCMF
ncbi:MAG: Methionyl-tRNA formyltransferase [Parcubacteria group bacterium GW2011_GWA2_43_11]|nr:MAG: Methionyl-tRNA formyltransferase [Parcubacteria group bacterium GW2011_GWC2_42_11]KKS85384.1 MAG: Methionyl-tRNA formyltransferase [Parcubacteria group bacterium GW2011_GWA2_43_11]